MMKIRTSLLAAPLLALFFILRTAAAQEIVAIPSKPTGIYSVGERASWRLRLREYPPPRATGIRFILKRNGLTAYREGMLPIENGVATLDTVLDRPGTVLAELKATLPGREITALAGTAFGPGKIGPSEERPSDFDAFWNHKLAELRETPADPLVETADSGRPAVDYFKVRMNHIRGARIYGQLARPKRTGKLPALLILQWAGLYPLQRDWVIGKAEAGWLVMNIMAHDLPFDQPLAFYDEAGRAAHANYQDVGNDDRERSTFLRMYLSCYRAAQYLTTRPEWDGRTLVVIGASQGGMQAIATAALHPKVTAVLVESPAGCDMNGPAADRAPGWPAWYWRTQGKDPERVRNAGRYFDIVNFASRVTCPTLVVLGLIDLVCPAPGIFAMTNQLKGPKEVVAAPQAGHGGTNETFNRHSKAWFAALVKGAHPMVRSIKSLP